MLSGENLSVKACLSNTHTPHMWGVCCESAYLPSDSMWWKKVPSYPDSIPAWSVDRIYLHKTYIRGITFPAAPYLPEKLTHIQVIHISTPPTKTTIYIKQIIMVIRFIQRTGSVENNTRDVHLNKSGSFVITGVTTIKSLSCAILHILLTERETL